MAKSDRDVPQTWSSDSEGAIAETSASALNDTRIDVWRSKLTSTGGSDELTVIDQVPWDWTMYVLKTNMASSISVRWRTGSQWSCRRVGVMWSRWRVPVIRRAAAFWTACNRRIRPPVIPIRRQLQQSRCDDTNAWTNILATSTDNERMIGRSWRSWWYADRHTGWKGRGREMEGLLIRGGREGKKGEGGPPGYYGSPPDLGVLE